MNLKTWLAGLAGAMALGLVAVSAEAAPAGGVNLKGAAAQTTDVQPATYYDRRYRYRRHYHYDYPRYRYRYRYYRPGIRFYYGPPRRYYRRHWDW
jgi:hypothetical protein